MVLHFHVATFNDKVLEMQTMMNVTHKILIYAQILKI